MTDVVAAIEARLGEMEAAARGVASGPWEWEAEDGLNDPAAVLRMVAGLRAIVARCRLILDSWEAMHGGDPDAAMWPDVNRRERHQARETLDTIAAMFPAVPAAASEGDL